MDISITLDCILVNRYIAKSVWDRGTLALLRIECQEIRKSVWQRLQRGHSHRGNFPITLCHITLHYIMSHHVPPPASDAQPQASSL